MDQDGTSFREAYMELVQCVQRAHDEMHSVLAGQEPEAADPRVVATAALAERVASHGRAVGLLLAHKMTTEAAIIARSIFESTWLMLYFDSSHPDAEHDLREWLGGRTIRPARVRRALADDTDAEYRTFLDTAYSHLSRFTHPVADDPFGQATLRVVEGYAAQGLLGALTPLLMGLAETPFQFSGPFVRCSFRALSHALAQFTEEWPPEDRSRILSFLEFARDVVPELQPSADDS